MQLFHSSRGGSQKRALKALSSRLVASLTLACALTAASSASAQSKVAVVDVRRAVLETEEGLRVQATLKKLFDNRQVDLDKKQTTLQQEKENLEKDAQAGKVPKDTLQKKWENIQKQAAEIQGLMMDYQREMQRKESEMTTPILQRVLGIVKRIAGQEGYEMVLDKSAVPYFRADLELTDKTIQMYNSGQTGDAAAPKPPAAGAAKTPAAPAPSAPPKR